jgi:hypothetical protein
MHREGRSAERGVAPRPASESPRNNTGTFADFPAPAIIYNRLAELRAVDASWSMLQPAEQRAAILGQARP